MDERTRELLQQVAERRRAEEALHRANERMELALHRSNVMVWEIEIPEGDFRLSQSHYVNAWEQLGYTDVVRGRQLVEDMHPDDVAPVTEAVRRHLAGNTTEFEWEVRFRHVRGGDAAGERAVARRPT